MASGASSEKERKYLEVKRVIDETVASNKHIVFVDEAYISRNTI